MPRVHQQSTSTASAAGRRAGPHPTPAASTPGPPSPPPFSSAAASSAALADSSLDFGLPSPSLSFSAPPSPIPPLVYGSGPMTPPKGTVAGRQGTPCEGVVRELGEEVAVRVVVDGMLDRLAGPKNPGPAEQPGTAGQPAKPEPAAPARTPFSLAMSGMSSLADPIRASDSFPLAWEKCRQAGWSWKKSSALHFEYYYVLPGGRGAKGGGREGVDFFEGEEGVRRFIAK